MQKERFIKVVYCDGMFVSGSDFLVMYKAETAGRKCTGPTAIGNCNDLAANRDLFLSPCYSNRIRLKRGPLIFCLVFYLARVRFLPISLTSGHGLSYNISR
jgi:hypothetical protein